MFKSTWLRIEIKVVRKKIPDRDQIYTYLLVFIVSCFIIQPQ
jgi:hypothetical protein